MSCLNLPDTTPAFPKSRAPLYKTPSLQGSKSASPRYPLPFGLNVENKDGQAVCTKAGPGGEQVGDILRYTTAWYIGAQGALRPVCMCRWMWCCVPELVKKSFRIGFEIQSLL